MKSATALPSRPLLDSPLRRTKMPLRAVRTCGAEITTTAENKKSSEMLTERFRELAVIRFNRVCVWCGMCHNVEMDLCGTVCECVNRLWFVNYSQIKKKF